MLASPLVGARFPGWAMQASPPRSTPPPPLRDRMRLKTLHTGIHTKPTRASPCGPHPAPHLPRPYGTISLEAKLDIFETWDMNRLISD